MVDNVSMTNSAIAVELLKLAQPVIEKRLAEYHNSPLDVAEVIHDYYISMLRMVAEVDHKGLHVPDTGNTTRS